MEQAHWVFEYQYRDGGNFKTQGQVLVWGDGEEAEATIRACLEWGDQFVAEQVGIPSLCPEHWATTEDVPSDLDHAFHEFVALRRAGTVGDRPVWGTLDTLLRRFRQASGRWDLRLSPNCDL